MEFVKTQEPQKYGRIQVVIKPESVCSQTIRALLMCDCSTCRPFSTYPSSATPKNIAYSSNIGTLWTVEFTELDTIESSGCNTIVNTESWSVLLEMSGSNDDLECTVSVVISAFKPCFERGILNDDRCHCNEGWTGLYCESEDIPLLVGNTLENNVLEAKSYQYYSSQTNDARINTVRFMVNYNKDTCRQ